MTSEPKKYMNCISPATFPVIGFNCACTSALYPKKLLVMKFVAKRQVLCF
jgi:hypothetical protein